MMRFSWIKAAGGKLPAHSLHHVCDKAVRDARTGLLCQIEGVFQLLNGPNATATRPPLLLQLDKSDTKDFVSCAMQNQRIQQDVFKLMECFTDIILQLSTSI